MRRPVSLSLLFLALSTACGPSFQRVYDGDVKFEHCYATDENETVAIDDKRACWHEWRTSYTYGQSRDRVEYATTRYSALSRDDKVASKDAQLVASAKLARTVAAPVPTSAFAPPPNMLPPTEPSSKAAPAREAPRAECSSRCLATWQTCHEACKEKGCDACDKKYGQCVPSCFHDEPRRGAK